MTYFEPLTELNIKKQGKFRALSKIYDENFLRKKISS